MAILATAAFGPLFCLVLNVLFWPAPVLAVYDNNQ
jgi:hypothetical protein